MGSPAIPSTPSAPAAPAASAPAPSAPAPAATSSAPPVAPPAGAQAPAAAPAAVAAVAAGAPAAAPEPKNTDFPNDGPGQVKFLTEHRKWEQAAKAVPAAAAEPNPAAVAASLGAQPGEAEAPKPGEPATAAVPAPAPAPTPQALDSLLEKTPALKAMLDAPEHKAAKDALFDMSRRLAAAGPIVEMFPTKGDADFAVQHTQELLALKTASMRAAVDPANLPQALDLFDQQFQVVNDKGEPVMDAEGKPSYAADRRTFLNGLIDREVSSYQQQFQTDLEGLRQKLATGSYPNEAARALDQDRLDKLDLAVTWAAMWEQIKDGSILKSTPPEIPADADPAFRAWAERERAEIAEREAALERQRQEAQGHEKGQKNAQFEYQVRTDAGAIAGRLIGETLRQAIDAGTYIPESYLQEKHFDRAARKETNTSAIAVRIYDAFEDELHRVGSRNLMEMAQHELLPQNDQTRAIRKDWFQRKAAEIIPRLVKKEIDRIQALVGIDQSKQAERERARAQGAQREPATGGSSLPSGTTEAQLRTQAEEAAKKLPGYAEASAGDKQARMLTQLHRLRKG